MLLCIVSNAATSTRGIANKLGIQHGLVWSALGELVLHIFRPCTVQAMGPDDHPSRLECVRWFLHQTNEDIKFPDIVLFTYESQFTREGMLKLHNLHEWAYENPHITLVHGHQRRIASTFGLVSWATTCLGLTCCLHDSGGQCTECSWKLISRYYRRKYL